MGGRCTGGFPAMTSILFLLLSLHIAKPTPSPSAHEYEQLPSGGYVVRKVQQPFQISMDLSADAMRESADTLSKIGRWCPCPSRIRFFTHPPIASFCEFVVFGDVHCAVMGRVRMEKAFGGKECTLYVQCILLHLYIVSLYLFLFVCACLSLSMCVCIYIYICIYICLFVCLFVCGCEDLYVERGGRERERGFVKRIGW